VDVEDRSVLGERHLHAGSDRCSIKARADSVVWDISVIVQWYEPIPKEQLTGGYSAVPATKEADPLMSECVWSPKIGSHLVN
jgi:hypothetical protein